MNYEDKQEERRDYMRAKATRLDSEADSRMNRASALAGVMNGQPILIGHHSEKRHRRDIDRMDRDFQKASEATNEAAELRRKADAVGTGGISSDDANAIDKIIARIEKKEHDRFRMKMINALYRKRDADGLTSYGFTLERLDVKLADAYSWEKQPFPKWQVSNLGATIRADKKRLVVLEAQSARADECSQVEIAAGVSGGVAFKVTEDRDENRIIFNFDSKPSRRALDLLKAHGWRYSPSRVAHVRKISPNAIAYASVVAKALTEEA